MGLSSLEEGNGLVAVLVMARTDVRVQMGLGNWEHCVPDLQCGNYLSVTDLLNGGS